MPVIVLKKRYTGGRRKAVLYLAKYWILSHKRQGFYLAKYWIWSHKRQCFTLQNTGFWATAGGTGWLQGWIEPHCAHSDGSGAAHLLQSATHSSASLWLVRSLCKHCMCGWDIRRQSATHSSGFLWLVIPVTCRVYTQQRLSLSGNSCYM